MMRLARAKYGNISPAIAVHAATVAAPQPYLLQSIHPPGDGAVAGAVLLSGPTCTMKTSMSPLACASLPTNEPENKFHRRQNRPGLPTTILEKLLSRAKRRISST